MHCSFCQLSIIQTLIRLCVIHWVLTSRQLCPSHLRHLTPSLHSLACIWYSEPSTPPDDHTLGCLYWYSVPIRNTSGYLVACIWYSDHNLSSALEITSSLPTQGVRPWSCTLFIAHSCGPLRGSVSIQASSSNSLFQSTAQNLIVADEAIDVFTKVDAEGEMKKINKMKKTVAAKKFHCFI